MAVNLSFIGGAGWQFFDDNGVPLAGGKIYTYAAGTTTPLATYTARDGVTPNTNPIILDAAGRTPQQIWSTEGLLYKYVVKDADDVQIRSWDNIGSSFVASDLAADLANTSDNAKGDALVGFKQADASGFLANAVARTVSTKLEEFVSVKDFGAVGNGVANDAGAFTAALAAKQYITVPKGTYKLDTAITIDIPFKVEFDYGATWTGSGFTGGGVLIDYDPTGIGVKRRYNEQTSYIQSFNIDPDMLTQPSPSQFRVATKDGRPAIIGATVNDSAAGDGTFPTGVTGYGKLNRDGNVVFGVFGKVEQYTNGVSTSEFNTFNYKANPPFVFPPDRSFGVTNAVPVTVTVAAAGTYPSLIGVQICREGSVPNNYTCGIYSNPDAVTNFGILIDADSTNGPIAAGVFKTPGTNATSSAMFLQMTNSSPNAASRFLRCYSSGGIQLMGIKSDGRLAFDAAALTQTTVGSAGGASSLPATPTGYLKVDVNGAAKVIPYYEP